MYKLLRHSWIIFCLSLLVGISWAWSLLHTHYATLPALDVWVLSVGQGESVLLREASGRKILFDGGPDDTVLSELSSILPFWDNHIDMLILSHNHSDHITGLTLVLNRYQVDEVWASGALEKSSDFAAWQEALKTKHPLTRFVHAGFNEKFGTLLLQVFHPLVSAEGTTPKDQHDATVVVKATFGEEKILLTGDLNTQHEQDIIQYCHPPNCSLQAQVLQVPHHGSATGLSPEFLKAVSPQVAFISVGQNNKFHHPRSVILQELTNAHLPFFRTDQDGQIHFILYADQLLYSRVDGSVPR